MRAAGGALPISIVVGADGRVALTVLMGSVSREGLREILAPLLPDR